MSDVIRNAIIKLGIQLSNPDLKIPSLEPAIKQQEKLAEAVKAQTAAASASATAKASATKATTLERSEEDALLAALDKSSAAAIRARIAHEQLAEAKRKFSEANEKYGSGSFIGYQGEQEINKAGEKLTKAYDKADIADANALAAAKRQVAAASREAAAAANAEAAAKKKEENASNAAEKAALKLEAAKRRVGAAYVSAAAGSLQVVRGLTLLNGAQNETIEKAIRHFAVVQGIIDVSRGAANISKSLAAARKAEAAASALATTSTLSLSAASGALTTALTPVGVAVLVVAGGTYLAVQAYEALTTSAMELRDAERDRMQGAQSQATGQSLANSYLKLRIDQENELTSILDTNKDKESAYRKVLADMNADVAQAKKLAARAVNESPETGEETLQAAILLMGRQRDAAKGLLGLRREETREADKNLETARAALKVEEDKQRSIQASFGARTAAERNKVRDLLDKAEAGTLDRKGAIKLSKLGGSAVEDISDLTLSKFDDGIGVMVSRIKEKLLGKDGLTDARVKATKAEETVNELHGVMDGVNGVAKETADAIVGLLQGVTKQIQEMQREQNRTKGAATIRDIQNNF